SDELFAAINTLVAGSEQPCAAPAGAETACLPELVNWDDALAYVGGDEELLRELVQTFVVEYPRWLRALDAALARNDPSGVHDAAHPFKNSLSVVGAKA